MLQAVPTSDSTNSTSLTANFRSRSHAHMDADRIYEIMVVNANVNSVDARVYYVDEPAVIDGLPT